MLLRYSLDLINNETLQTFPNIYINIYCNCCFSGGYQRNNESVIASSICNLFDSKLISPID